MLQRKLVSENKKSFESIYGTGTRRGSCEVCDHGETIIILAIHIKRIHRVDCPTSIHGNEKKKSRKGDFCHQIKADLNQLEIKRTENEIKEMSKYEWKKYLKIKIKEAALKHLQNENARLFETM